MGPQKQAWHQKLLGRRGKDQRTSTVEVGSPETSTLDDSEHVDKYGLFHVCDCEPSTNNSYPIDVVAVHGINGDAFHTWTSDGKLWLRDFLSKDLPDARIFTFGYASKISFTCARGELRDFARSLLESLRMARSTRELSKRPIVFVCHSMGGLVVKEACVIADLDAEDYHEIGDSIAGILFLGTPHRGSSAVSFPRILTNILNFASAPVAGWSGTARTDLLRLMEKNSPELVRLTEDFRNRVKDIRIISFVEQDATPPLTEPIVGNDSATLGIPHETIVPMPGCNHRNICRFDDISRRGYKNILFHVQNVASRTTHSDKALSLEEKDCLRSLAFKEMESRHQSIDPAIPGTCGWLRDMKAFQDWASGHRIDEESALLWLKGKPGSGKSTMMKQTLLAIRKEYPNSIILAFFFHARGVVDEEHNLLGMYRSLLHQLLSQCPDHLRDFLPLFERKQDTLPSKWQWQLAELRDQFEHLVCKTSRIQTGFLFIDALDEGGETNARSVVSFVDGLIKKSNTNTNTKLRVCMSSRQFPHISVRNCQEIITHEANEADIKHYVDQKLTVSGLKMLKLNDEIIKKASGVFLWVVLVVQILQRESDRGKSSSELSSTLHDVPQDLEILFGQYIEDMKGMSQQDCRLALALVEWTLYALVPLDVNEMYLAVIFSTSNDPVKDLKEAAPLLNDKAAIEKKVRHLTRGLIEIVSVPLRRWAWLFQRPLERRTTRVQFIHESVRSHMLHQGGLRTLQRSAGESEDRRAHNRCTKACLRYMNLNEFTANSGTIHTMLSERVYRNLSQGPKYEFLRYCYHKWSRHAKRAELEECSQADLVVWFLNDGERVMREVAALWTFGNNDASPNTESKAVIRGAWDFHTTNLLFLFSVIGLSSCVSECIATGGYLDSKFEDSRLSYALIAAVANKNTSVATLLVEAGASLNIQDEDGDTPFHYLARSDQAEQLGRLLDNDDTSMDVPNKDGFTPLSLAVHRGFLEGARVLLNHNATVHSVNEDVDAPLALAIDGFHPSHDSLWRKSMQHSTDHRTPDSPNLRLVKLFVEHYSVDINQQNLYGVSPLLQSISLRRDDVTEYLLRRNDVDVNSTDPRKRTALMWAVRTRALDTVSLLVNNPDTQLGAVNMFGETAYSLVSEEKGRKEWELEDLQDRKKESLETFLEDRWYGQDRGLTPWSEDLKKLVGTLLIQTEQVRRQDEVKSDVLTAIRNLQTASKSQDTERLQRNISIVKAQLYLRPGFYNGVL